MADVVLPEGASLGMDNDIPGMKKGRIEHALQKEGYETVTFYNVDIPWVTVLTTVSLTARQSQLPDSTTGYGDHHPA